MIVLTVLSYNGERAQGLSAQFDELGGTVGRADNNQLVLPDPERTISRVHARVVYRAGRYAIVDNGSNPISLNGIPVGAGREHPLNPGDEVQIGGYVLQASAASAATSDDPFADLFGEAGVGLAAPTPTPAPMAATKPPPVRAPVAATAPWPQPAAASGKDWLAAPAAPSPSPAARAAPVARPPAAAPSPGHIPEDWDPFAPDADSSPAPTAPVDAAHDLLLDVPMGGAGSLDDLFGLGGGMPMGDPLGAAPAAAQLQQPNMASSADPLEALSRTATLTPMSRSDHASELSTPMLLPKVTPAARPPEPAALPKGAIFSWDDPPRDGRVVTLPGVHLGEAPPPKAPPSAAVSAPLYQAPAPAANRPAPAAAAPSHAMGSVTTNTEALLAAFLDGLGTPGLRMAALTPDSMQLIGQLLRESMRGTVELLVARAALKREMRADMTMIVARENNPLKFSPTVEVALSHLLGTPSPGFMAPAPAVRDAFDDLRAHQLGVMAGMRAALEGVLQRFDPQQLEAKITRKSAITSLIPGARKARLWELFQELFTQLQSEAQDDFDELFGKAFLRAYEDQLDRLQGEPGPR